MVLPFARGLGLSHSWELTVGQNLYLYADTILTIGVLIPLITFVTCYFAHQKVVVSRLVLVASCLLAMLSFVNLVSVANTGTLLTWELLVDSIKTGIADPDLASEYVNAVSILKLGLVLGSTCAIAFGLRRYAKGNRPRLMQRAIGLAFLLLVCGSVSIYLLAHVSMGSHLRHVRPGVNFVKHQLVALANFDNKLSRAFDGLGLEESLRKFQQQVSSPVTVQDSAFVGSEAQSNIVWISLETGPQKVIDFESSESEFPHLHKLAERAFVARQHFSTKQWVAVLPSSSVMLSILTQLYSMVYVCFYQSEVLLFPC